MKNDYEFLKDKLENSGVKAPQSIDERYVLDRLEGIEPEQAPAPVLRELKPKKRRTGWIIGIAAAFVAVVGLSVFGAIRLMKKPPVSPIMSADIPLKRFESYDEVRAQVKENAGRKDYLTRDGLDYEMMAMEDGAYNISEKTAPQSADSGGSGNSSDSHSETYRQVEGVDEADIVKTDGRYLYVVAGDESVGIFSADDQPRLLAEIVPGALSATPDEVDEDDGTDVFVEEMFLYDEKLVLVGVSRDKSFDYSAVSLVYDVSDIGSIRLVDSFHQSGNYTASRMIGDNLYMISEYRLRRDDFEIPTCYSGDVKREIPINCVYSVEEPEDNDMLIVGGYSLSNSSGEVNSTAVIGAVEDVYCNEDNLYIYTSKWNYRDWAVTDGFGADLSDDAWEQHITTDIFKVSLHDGITFTAYGTVEGWLDSRYSLDEHNGFLRVAATLENANYDDVNALYVLDENLKKVGSVTGFAENESIKAVRYVGDTAYVITYEQTDPLFVIDVSDPTAPVILGEVKIDGFSSMLVPVDENTVLGLGFYTEDSDRIDMQVQMGFKLALFDVSDKTAPKVLDEKIYREHYSDVMYEPRALVYNPDRGDYLIPLNAFNIRSVTDSNVASDDISENRGGALNIKVENGRIVEIDHPAAESDDGVFYPVSRCLYVGDTIYMISNESGLAENVRVFTAKYQ